MRKAKYGYRHSKRGSARGVVLAAVFLVLAALGAFYLVNGPVGPKTPGVPENYTNFGRAKSIADYTVYVPGSTLTVHPRAGGLTAPIGGFTAFVVHRDGELITYHDLTYEIVEGRDCAAIYYDGSLRGLGVGEVVVKAWLDVDPNVFGYAKTTIVPATESNRYTEEAIPFAPVTEVDEVFEASVEGFPESYRVHLRALHEKYPEWIFVPMYTGVDFFDAVNAEASGGRNVILMWNSANLIKSHTVSSYNPGTGEYTGTGWVDVNGIAASEYMDPRNYLDERAVFQFETLGFNEDVHTVEGIDGLLEGSFMHAAKTSYLDTDGQMVEDERTYAEAIYEAGRSVGINPYFIAAKIRQEIGSSPSNSATGTCPGWEGYYNFYNIGATDGKGEVERGLAYAAGSGSYNRPWTSPYKSIIGGAMFLREAYIDAGQQTGYLQKFNVNPDGQYERYTNQYMTNVAGAVAQARNTYDGYESIGKLAGKIVFSIPVYNNMPGNTRQATGISLGGNSYGVAIRDAVLRTGPAAYYNPIEDAELSDGDTLRIVRIVPTTAGYYMNTVAYPVWYECELTRGGKTIAGFVSEEYILRGSSVVLPAGNAWQLYPSFTPAECDDVVRYISENPAVATVDAYGVVTARKPGVVNIVGYTSGGAIDCFRITVTESEGEGNETDISETDTAAGE